MTASPYASLHPENIINGSRFTVSRSVLQTGKLAGKMDPDLVVMEATYGVVMALTLVTTAQLGIAHYDDRMGLVIAILAMDFVWGAIDLVIFFRSDVSAQHRRRTLLRKLYGTDECNRECMRGEVNSELDGTIFDVLDGETRDKAVDIVLGGKMTNIGGMLRDYGAYLFNAVTAFCATFLTAIPPALCILLINPLHDAYYWASVVSSLILFGIGYYFSPFEKTSVKAFWGLTLVGAAMLLTGFAAFLGG